MATPAVLLGYGSIGRYHAGILAKRGCRLAVVEINEAVHDAVRRDYPEAVVARTLAALPAWWSWRDTLAVIATWGPSHAALFADLVGHGVRRILCEKPLAHAVAAGAEMLRVARERDVALGVHQRFRYMGVADGLRQVAREHALGDPIAVVVSGGALCLVTNGIHYIDLASELFGTRPQSVVSTAVPAPINPRSPSLMYYGGSAVWSFGGGREAVISFTNQGSLRASVSVYFPHAVAELRPTLEVTVRRRPDGEVRGLPITRSGLPVETPFEGSLPSIRSGIEATQAVLDEIEAGRVRTFTPVAALDAVEACIAALVAGRTGRSVNLPISPDSPDGQEEWPIS